MGRKQTLPHNFRGWLSSDGRCCLVALALAGGFPSFGIARYTVLHHCAAFDSSASLPLAPKAAICKRPFPRMVRADVSYPNGAAATPPKLRMGCPVRRSSIADPA